MNGSLFADNGGKLTVSGTPLAPVVFTSINDFPQSENVPVPGDWGGIEYVNGSSGSISYTTIKYGGGSGPQGGSGDLVVGATSSPLSVTDSTLADSSTNDVQVNSGSPVFKHDTFGLATGGNYSIDNTDGGTAQASYDYWGSPTGPGTSTSGHVTTKPWYSKMSSGTSSSSSTPATAAVLGSYGASGSVGAQVTGGTGAIYLNELDVNPESTAPSGTSITYFDMRLWSQSTFTSGTIKDCAVAGGLILLFWNGTAWQPVSGQTTASGCVSATLGTSTSPKLSQLRSSNVILAAGLIATTTKLTSSLNPSTYGQTVKLTASVTPGYGTASGKIAFTDGSQTLSTVTLSSDKATFSTSSLKAGTHSLKATFTAASGSGDGNSSGSLTQTVKKAALTIKASNQSGTYGGTMPSLTWTANFVNGDTKTTALTTQPTCKTTAQSSSGKIKSAAGSYPITCSAAVADANYTLAYSAGTLTVKAASAVVAYAGPTTITQGKAATLSATLKTSSGTGINGRKLTITLGSGSGAQSCIIAATNSAGSGSCNITKVTVAKGSQTVKVSFAGDTTGSSNFYAAGSATKSVTVS